LPARTRTGHPGPVSGAAGGRIANLRRAVELPAQFLDGGSCSSNPCPNRKVSLPSIFYHPRSRLDQAFDAELVVDRTMRAGPQPSQPAQQNCRTVAVTSEWLGSFLIRGPCPPRRPCYWREERMAVQGRAVRLVLLWRLYVAGTFVERCASAISLMNGAPPGFSFVGVEIFAGGEILVCSEAAEPRRMYR